MSQSIYSVISHSYVNIVYWNVNSLNKDLLNSSEFKDKLTNNDCIILSETYQDTCPSLENYYSYCVPSTKFHKV